MRVHKRGQNQPKSTKENGHLCASLWLHWNWPFRHNCILCIPYIPEWDEGKTTKETSIFSGKKLKVSSKCSPTPTQWLHCFWNKVLLLPIPINLLKYFASNQVKLPSPNGFRPVLRCGVVSTSIHNIYIYIYLMHSRGWVSKNIVPMILSTPHIHQPRNVSSQWKLPKKTPVTSRFLEKMLRSPQVHPRKYPLVI